MHNSVSKVSPSSAKAQRWARTGAICSLAAIVLACSATLPGAPADDDGSVGSGGSGVPGVGGGTQVGVGGGNQTGVGGGSTIPPDKVEVGGIKVEGNPAYYRVVRMTHGQWEKSVRDLLKLPALPGVSSTFFPDPKGGAIFSNNEESLFVTDTLATDYERAAQQVADEVTGDSAALARLGNANSPQGFIDALGERAHKRPLTAEESAEYLALWNEAATLLPDMSAFAAGARIFIEALLQSTHFVHRIELSNDGARLSGPELATKISYLLLDTLPSEEFLTDAKDGDLDTNAGLASRVSAMLDDDSVMENIRRFFDEYYSLEREATVVKDPVAFPNFTEATAAALRDADVRFFDHIFTTGKGVKDIFLSTTAFANRDIAPIYGLSVTGTQLQQVDVGPTRPGFLTRAGFLSVNGTLKQPDPIHRGVDINRRMLCAVLEPPPGNIPPIPTPKAGQTNREAISELTGVGICADCHNGIINPPGFSLEGFDAIGQARTEDAGKPVDTTGTFAGIPGNPAFSGAADMAQLVAESETAHACFSARLAEFTLMRDLGSNEEALITALMQQSQGSDSSIKSLILALVQSPAFTNAKTGPQ